MTWVCLKMMYTPSSWKVFHRDRIFLNQSMLGVTLCSDKAISGWWFGTMEFYDFPYIGNFIIPTDELIFFRGVGQPPTRLTVHYLVGGFKHVLFSIKFGIILSIDFHIFQDG